MKFILIPLQLMDHEVQSNRIPFFKSLTHAGQLGNDRMRESDVQIAQGSADAYPLQRLRHYANVSSLTVDTLQLTLNPGK